MKSNTTLHLIEPTLFDQTGHGYSYVTSLLQANQDFGFDMQVWLDARGDRLLNETACRSHPVFHRSWRRIQKPWYFHKIFKKKEPLYICTSEHLDLVVLDRLAPRTNKASRIFLHFHQYNGREKKMQALRHIAKRHPEFVILTPTEKLQQIFQEAGFPHTAVVPCPSFPRQAVLEPRSARFEKVIYAGAARKDKGFPEVVDLIAHLRQTDQWTPFQIQTSPPHSQEYDKACAEALQRLQQLPMEKLSLIEHTLNQQEYQSLFFNSICLLIYDQALYANKFSGVALDAFYAGSPVIAAANTWMGHVAVEYGAGIALSDYRPAALNQAISEIASNYREYHERAKNAALALEKKHDPKNTLRVVQEFL